MRRIITFTTVLALASLGLAGPAWASGSPGTCTTTGPAAANPSAPNSGHGTSSGGACSVEGTATISTVLAFEAGISSFSFPSGVSSSVQSPNSPWSMYVYSNTPSYYVSEAVTSPFTGANASSDVLKASDFAAGTDGAASACDGVTADSQSQFADDSATDGISNPLTVVSVPCPSSGHNYQNNNSTVSGASSGFPTPYDEFSVQGWSFTSSALTGGGNAPADTYTGDVTLALWA